jgi:uncharacterized membrane protein
MVMKNLTMVLSIVFALMAISGSVLAVSDIQLRTTDAAGNEKGTTTAPVSTCPGPITVQDVRILVKNLAADTDTFSVSMTLPQGWDGAIKSSITLASGEEKQLNLFYVNMPYTTTPGKYYITVTVKSGINPNDVVMKDIAVEVLACHMVELKVIDSSKEMCQESRQSLVYKINVTNKGKWEEEFVLSSSLPWVKFSQAAITLPSQGTKNIDVIVTPPSDMQPGEQTIPITVKSSLSYASDSKTIKAFLMNCFNADASITPLENTVCLGKSDVYTLTIQNKGTLADTYKITGPDWVKIQFGEMSIPAGQTRQIDVFATPKTAGRASFSIEIVSANDTAAKKTVAGNIVTEECRGVALVLTPTQVKACKGSDATFNLAIKNTGVAEDTYTIKLSRGSADQANLTVAKGETKTVKLTVNTANLTGQQLVLVQVTDGVVSDQATANISIEDCYSATVSVASDKKITCPCGSVNFSVAITNTGTLNDTFKAKLDSQEKSVQMDAGKTDTVMLQKVLSCDQKGNLTVTVEVSSDHMAKIVRTVTIELKQKDLCYSVHLTTSGTVEKVQEGRATAVEVKATNDGESSDTYAISVSGPAWAYASPLTLALASKTTDSIYLYLAPPLGTNESEYSVKLTAKSSAVTSSVDFKVRVGGQGNVSVQNVTQPVNVTIDATTNVTANATANATNVTIGDRPNDVVLNVSFGSNVTGQITAVEERPFWKTLTVAVITIVIILILVVRFAFLFKK